MSEGDSMKPISIAILFAFLGIAALNPALADDLTPFASVTPTSIHLAGSPGQRLNISFTVTSISQDPTLSICRIGSIYGQKGGDPPLTYVPVYDSQEIRINQSRTFTLFTFDVPSVRTGTTYSYSSVGVCAYITRWNNSMEESYAFDHWVPYGNVGYSVPLNATDVLITVIPEPSSILALLCGISGVGCIMWRRKMA